MWTPINKKLPNAVETVLTTVEHQHRWVSLMWIGSDNKSWYYADNGERIPKEFKIIAWQSLPETYNEVE